MRRWLKLVAMSLALGLLPGCGGCGASGERGKNRNKDVPRPGDDVLIQPAKEQPKAKDEPKAKEEPKGKEEPTPPKGK